MNSKMTFLIGCIGARLLLALYAKNTTPEALQKMGYVAIIPAIGFMYLYMNDLRKVAFEAGGSVWWNDLRPIHGVLYLLFAMYAIKEKQCAWIILLFDVMIGLVAWYNAKILGKS